MDGRMWALPDPEPTPLTPCCGDPADCNRDCEHKDRLRLYPARKWEGLTENDRRFLRTLRIGAE